MLGEYADASGSVGIDHSPSRYSAKGESSNTMASMSSKMLLNITRFHADCHTDVVTATRIGLVVKVAIFKKLARTFEQNKGVYRTNRPR